MAQLPRDRASAAVLASFAGDSLALGAHWEYDAQRLAQTFGRVDTLLAPAPGSYHAGKEAGHFTHYGDQALMLLRFLAQAKGFTAQPFAEAWQEFMRGYAGYLDNASKTTMQMFEFGIDEDPAGANSHDLAGAARMAPLLVLPWDSVEDLAAAARAQARVTHSNPQILDSAEFLARAAWHAAMGEDPAAAMRRAAEAEYQSAPVGQWLALGLDSAAKDTVAAIGAFGQSCHVESAFPGVVHLIAKYPGDLEACLVECVMAGGDSAARAMAAGMVLGAALGPEAIPKRWLDAMQARREIETLIQSLA